jgi:hypothetical protein
MGAAPKDSLGTVGALITTMRQIGMSSGIAISGMLFTVLQTRHTQQFATEHTESQLSERLATIVGYGDTVFIFSFLCFLGIGTSVAIWVKSYYLIEQEYGK